MWPLIVLVLFLLLRTAYLLFCLLNADAGFHFFRFDDLTFLLKAMSWRDHPEWSRVFQDDQWSDWNPLLLALTSWTSRVVSPFWAAPALLTVLFSGLYLAGLYALGRALAPQSPPLALLPVFLVGGKNVFNNLSLSPSQEILGGCLALSGMVFFVRFAQRPFPRPHLPLSAAILLIALGALTRVEISLLLVAVVLLALPAGGKRAPNGWDIAARAGGSLLIAAIFSLPHADMFENQVRSSRLFQGVWDWLKTFFFLSPAALLFGLTAFLRRRGPAFDLYKLCVALFFLAFLAPYAWLLPPAAPARIALLFTALWAPLGLPFLQRTLETLKGGAGRALLLFAVLGGGTFAFFKTVRWEYRPPPTSGGVLALAEALIRMESLFSREDLPLVLYETHPLDPSVPFWDSYSHRIIEIAAPGRTRLLPPGRLSLPRQTEVAAKKAGVLVIAYSASVREALPPDYVLLARVGARAAFLSSGARTCVFLRQTLRPHDGRTEERSLGDYVRANSFG